MASDEKTADPEVAKEVEAPPSKAEQPPPPPPPPPGAFLSKCMAVDVVLRVVLFAATLTALLVMVTSKQTKLILFPGFPFRVPVEAKFNQSPAFIYFAAALAVACFYSIITALASISVIGKPAFSTSFLLYFAILDVVVLGLVASAIGTAGGVAYVGLKGNSHAMWTKVCNNYGKYCQHLAGSLAAALFASFVLVFLVILSIVSLHKKIPK